MIKTRVLKTNVFLSNVNIESGANNWVKIYFTLLNIKSIRGFGSVFHPVTVESIPPFLNLSKPLWILCSITFYFFLLAPLLTPHPPHPPQTYALLAHLWATITTVVLTSLSPHTEEPVSSSGRWEGPPTRQWPQYALCYCRIIGTKACGGSNPFCLSSLPRAKVSSRTAGPEWRKGLFWLVSLLATGNVLIMVRAILQLHTPRVSVLD